MNAAVAQAVPLSCTCTDHFTAVRTNTTNRKGLVVAYEASADRAANKSGKRLLDYLRGLQSDSSRMVRTTEGSDAESIWQLSGLTWTAEVVVAPSRWLGLKFESTDPTTDQTVSYEIDTDLYDISRKQQKELADEIEDAIIEFLDHLYEGNILRGHHGSDVVLVFPLDGAFVRVARGRFLTRSSTHAICPIAHFEGAYVSVV